MKTLPLVALALVVLPPLAQAAEQCTVSVESGQMPAPVEPLAATVARSQSQSGDTSASSGFSQLPFVVRVAGAGAQVLDFGVVHGLRLVGARSGQEFRVFSVLPDGSAAVEGAPLAMTVKQLALLASSEVTQLGRLAGFDGLFVRSGAQFQVFYASPDGQAVVPGILRDADGNNLTRDQVRGVPGAIPTVELQAGAATSPAAETGPEPSLAAVQKATFGTVGPASAPEVFMLIDPQCIYSVRAYQQIKPYADAGRIKLSLVPVAILDHEDLGRSSKSALALLAKSPGEIPTAWQRGDTNGTTTPEAQTRLGTNMAIATAIGLQGTPTLLWRGRDGRAMRIVGVPTDIAALIASAGG